MPSDGSVVSSSSGLQAVIAPPMLPGTRRVAKAGQPVDAPLATLTEPRRATPGSQPTALTLFWGARGQLVRSLNTGMSIGWLSVGVRLEVAESESSAPDAAR